MKSERNSVVETLFLEKAKATDRRVIV